MVKSVVQYVSHLTSRNVVGSREQDSETIIDWFRFDDDGIQCDSRKFAIHL